MQQTISHPIKFSGKGLHNNKICNLYILPSCTGLTINHIPIHPFYVNNTDGMTSINNYSQIEHLMSALNALKIDNVSIFVDSDELPILDGCSRLFVDKLKNLVKPINKPISKLIITNNVIVNVGKSYIKYIPSDNNFLEYVCIVDFPYVGEQRFTWCDNDFLSYYNDISQSKTFFWDEQYKNVIKNHKAKGVNKTNTIILTANNHTKFSNNEFAKHKLLDLIGDIGMLKLNGKIIAYRPGHKINNLFARKLIRKSFKNSNIKIPFIKLPDFFINKNLETKILTVFKKQNYIDNKLTLEFEKKLCQYLNVSNVIAVNSGTSSIIVALLSLELNNFDYIIVPRLTFWATYQAVKLLGKKVILVDIGDDFQLDLNIVKKIIPKYNVRAILTVHLYGMVSNNFTKLKNLCNLNNIILIEDSSQAFGTYYNKTNILTNSYISCVSMYPTKLFGSCGNSGFIVTYDNKLANKMRTYRDNGRKSIKYEHHNIGGNFVPNSLNNIFNLHKLEYFDKIILNTKYKFHIYQKELSNLRLFNFPKLFNQSPNGFNFTLKILINNRRDLIITKMKSYGIDCQIIYPKFVDEQPGFCKNDIIILSDKKQNLCNNILSLPIYYDLTPYQQNYIINRIKRLDKLDSVIIGLGNMGYNHAKNLIVNSSYNLLGYQDIITKKNDLNLDRLVVIPKIDFAIITVNTKNHFNVSKNLITKGINLLVEKPGFINSYEFSKINELMIKNNVKIGISMLERYNDIEYINCNEYNRIEIYRITPYSKSFDPTLILYDLLIHDLDILVKFNDLKLDKLKIIKVVRNYDIYKIELKYLNLDIYLEIGNHKSISKRMHYYFKDNIKKKINFINNVNKIKLLHDDYINFLKNETSNIATIIEVSKINEFIDKLNIKKNVLSRL